MLVTVLMYSTMICVGVSDGFRLVFWIRKPSVG